MTTLQTRFSPLFFAIFLLLDNVSTFQGPAFFESIASMEVDAGIVSMNGLPVSLCISTSVTPEARVRNFGDMEITDLEIEIKINGSASEAVSWQGSLTPGDDVLIIFSSINIDVGQNMEFEILTVNGTADNEASNNTWNHEITSAPELESLSLTLFMRTDDSGDDIYWDIRNERGELVFDEGNETVIGNPKDAFTLKNNEPYQWELYLPEDGCYTLSIYDRAGNGLEGNGEFRLLDGEREELISGADFGSKLEYSFRIATGGEVTRDFVRIIDYNWRDSTLCKNGFAIEPTITVQNVGKNTIRSIWISYEPGGARPMNVYWNGELASLDTITISDPRIFINIEPKDDLFTYIEEINSQRYDFDNFGFIYSDFPQAPTTRQQILYLEAQLGDRAHEVYWEIVNDNDEVVIHGGNIKVRDSGGGQNIASPSDSGAYPSRTYLEEEIILPIEDRCYTVRFYDDAGDGIVDPNTNGYFTLFETNGNTIYDKASLAFDYSQTKFLFRKRHMVSTINEDQVEMFTVQPNPTSNHCIIRRANKSEMLELNIMDINGRTQSIDYHSTSSNNSGQWEVNVSHLKEGTYFIIVKGEHSTEVHKLIIQR